jgi:hypothetical protein
MLPLAGSYTGTGDPDTLPPMFCQPLQPPELVHDLTKAPAFTKIFLTSIESSLESPTRS